MSEKLLHPFVFCEMLVEFASCPYPTALALFERWMERFDATNVGNCPDGRDRLMVNVYALGLFHISGIYALIRSVNAVEIYRCLSHMCNHGHDGVDRDARWLGQPLEPQRVHGDECVRFDESLNLFYSHSAQTHVRIHTKTAAISGSHLVKCCAKCPRRKQRGGMKLVQQRMKVLISSLHSSCAR